jgi:hypothetical protein
VDAGSAKHERSWRDPESQPLGICIQLDREFRVRPGGLVLSLHSPEIAVLPTHARVRWLQQPARKRSDSAVGFLCGCIFVAPTQGWMEWFQQAVDRQVQVEELQTKH